MSSSRSAAHFVFHSLCLMSSFAMSQCCVLCRRPEPGTVMQSEGLYNSLDHKQQQREKGVNGRRKNLDQ